MSLGNDVISIAHLKTRKGDRNQRYYNKTYTENEIRLIKTLNIQHVEGFFWALKESAYKAYFRVIPKVIMSPKQFEVLTFDEKGATVKTPAGLMHSKVEFTEEYIHAVCSTRENGVNEIEYNVFQFKENFYQEVKTKIASYQNCGVDQVEISKDENNVPTLKLKNQQYLLSLSHDYNWGSYAYQKQSISV